MSARKFLFTLHHAINDHRIIAAALAQTPEEAAAIWGGELCLQEGGLPRCSTDPDQLGVWGTIKFGPELFREMDETDQALAGSLSGDVCYTHHGLNLLAHRYRTLEFVLRQTFIYPDTYCD